jgi:hypothetical protein
MTEQGVVAVLVLVLTPLTVWTLRVQRRLDSLAVALSGLALLISVLPIAALVTAALARLVAPGRGIQAPLIVLAAFSACSAILGPVMLLYGFSLRRREALPRSTLLLQLVHSSIWAILTFFDLGMTLDV